MSSGEHADIGLPGAKELHGNLREVIEERRFEALLLFDVDGFQQLNAERGEVTGDRIISLIEAFISSKGWQGYRIGGDEFGLILTRSESPFDSEGFREGIGLFLTTQTNLHVTISGGGVRDLGEGLCVDPRAAEILISTAHHLLTRAKQQGRNQIVYLPHEPVDALDTLKTMVRFYTELARINASFAKEMEVESRIDFLTGLYNRRGFEDISRKLTEASRRNDNPLALLYIDSDSLKRINDTRGHEAGDRFIIDMARILNEVVRGSDFTFRWGADEFAVLIDHATQDKAVALANRIRQAIESRTEGTVSIGIYCGVPESIDAAVNLADQALYRAKEAGKNRIEVAT